MTTAQRVLVISICIVLAIVMFVFGWRYLKPIFGWRYLILTAQNDKRMVKKKSPKITEVVTATRPPAPVGVAASGQDAPQPTAPQPTAPQPTAPQQVAPQQVAPQQVAQQPAAQQSANKLKNSLFETALENWNYWRASEEEQKYISALTIQQGDTKKSYVRIENPMKKLIGIQQRVSLASGAVYRLSGTVRSTITEDSGILFGGRIGVHFMGKVPDKEIVWMSEYNKWWRKSLVFTNTIPGVATVFVHMGYGGVASTGEFTDITIEKLSP